MLITLEGLDGSGKTTVWEALHDVYPDAVFTREPTDSWYGDAVYRSIGNEEADPLAELFLYTADHADHLANTIQPALNEGHLVVSDRYSDSRFAYQAATLAASDAEVARPMEYIRGIHSAFSRPPDATIYLDLDAQTAADRSGRTNKLEQDGYLSAVQDNYERLLEAEPERFVRVDATRSPEDVITAVESAFEDILDK